MYTNELLKSTNCKSTTAAFSKVRKSPPRFFNCPIPLPYRQIGHPKFSLLT